MGYFGILWGGGGVLMFLYIVFVFFMFCFSMIFSNIIFLYKKKPKKQSHTMFKLVVVWLD